MGLRGSDGFDMHVHACYNVVMRTTVELPNSLRAKLLELAARRGEKGFSNLVREAVERYLASHAGREEEVRRADSLLGSLTDAEADGLEESVRRLRERWR